MARFEGLFPSYVSVAERRAQASQRVAEMQKEGREISPVEITGQKIAKTFWGNAWCKNLESYRDYENRLPRGRSYVRNGAVIHLQIETGRVQALVQGSELYEVSVEIRPLDKKKWKQIKADCAGQIESLIELLKGKLSKSVMEKVSQREVGLFPSPGEITFRCSCPDRARLCKHVASSLYGVGARLDHAPELLFTLRGVDPAEMVDDMADPMGAPSGASTRRTLETDDLASIFGMDIDFEDDFRIENAPALEVPARSSEMKSSARSERMDFTFDPKPVPAKKVSKKKTSTARTSSSRKDQATKTRASKKKARTSKKARVTDDAKKAPAAKKPAVSKRPRTKKKAAVKKARS